MARDSCSVKGAEVSPLDSFSKLLLEKHERPDTISPEAIAEEWVAHSGLSALPSLSEIHRQLESYGLSLQQAAMPGLRGHHYCYRGGDPTILYEDADWRGAVEFTLLHEFYEVILDRLCGHPRRNEALPKAESCWQANRFAAAVLMQKNIFLQALHESHFDIVWMHRHFYRSYSAIAIRAVEVLNGIADSRRKELACAVYNRSGEPGDWRLSPPDEDFALRNEFRVGCAVYTSGLRLGKGGYPAHLMPKKGDGVLPGSIVELALSTGRPVLLRKATGFDAAGEKDLALLARPVSWFNKPSKVILEAMRLEDGYILEVQAKPLRPKVVSESYQRL